MIFTYKTKGTCSSSVEIEIEEDVIEKVNFNGGCSGNLKGIATLVEGQTVDAVIQKLSGIRCGFKSTSCPDQLAKALIKYKDDNEPGD